MRILIAPDKFKGSLDAQAVAEAIQTGWQRVFPDAKFDIVPIADGGEGTAAAFHRALGGEWRSCATVDALDRPIVADYIWLEKRQLAVIDMSAASGLWRLESAERDPWKASTYGTGLLIQNAIHHGATTLYLGLGGSATNDAGAGMAAALGWKFRDANHAELPVIPSRFKEIRQAEAASLQAQVIGICDVTHPLLGPSGCSAVFSPQKGALSADIDELDATLGHLSYLIDPTGALAELPGAGAAGGLGFGVLAFAGGKLAPGFEVVSELFDLPNRIAAADYVLTGEGKLDAQTLGGKGPAGIARLAREARKPVIAFAGKIEDEAQLSTCFDAVVPLTREPIPLEESMKRAAELLTLASERTARLLKSGEANW